MRWRKKIVFECEGQMAFRTKLSCKIRLMRMPETYISLLVVFRRLSGREGKYFRSLVFVPDFALAHAEEKYAERRVFSFPLKFCFRGNVDKRYFIQVRAAAK